MACYNPKPAYLMTVELHDKTTGELKLSKQLFFIKKSQINEFHENITMIPCGKCIGCRLDKANDWATRCTAEAKQWKTNCFITLTTTMTLRKERKNVQE